MRKMIKKGEKRNIEKREGERKWGKKVEKRENHVGLRRRTDTNTMKIRFITFLLRFRHSTRKGVQTS